MIKVLKKMDAILRVVAEKKDQATLFEISRQLKIHKATLSHILKTMQALGYLGKNAAKCYSIGPRIIDLAESPRRQTILQEIAAEHARALAEELHELASVSIMHDGSRYNIARVSVNQSVTVNASMEFRGSPYDTASGRLLTAYQDEENLRCVLKKNGLPGRYWDGIADREALNRKLSEIRSQGLAFWRADDGQSEAVAAPVFGPDKKVWATLGVAVPAYRFRGANREKIIRALKKAGEQMTVNLTLRYGGTDLRENQQKG